MTNERLSQPPWYKHRWPWILMSGPFLAMLACIVTIYLAFQKQDVLLVNGVKKTGLKIIEVPLVKDAELKDSESTEKKINGAKP